LNRQISRRLVSLETRAARFTKSLSFEARILLVHLEAGLTGVLLIEKDQPTRRVDATAEEYEKVRRDLDRRLAARQTLVAHTTA
jgi:hypothetical protein